MISKFFASCSALFDTTASDPAPACISCKLNGTLPANANNSSNALAPVSASPNNALNLILKFSISTPTPTMSFIARTPNVVPRIAPNRMVDAPRDCNLLSIPLKELPILLDESFTFLSASLRPFFRSLRSASIRTTNLSKSAIFNNQDIILSIYPYPLL